MREAVKKSWIGDRNREEQLNLRAIHELESTGLGDWLDQDSQTDRSERGRPKEDRGPNSLKDRTCLGLVSECWVQSGNVTLDVSGRSWERCWKEAGKKELSQGEQWAGDKGDWGRE